MYYNFEEEKKKIIKDLIERGYANTFINYAKFLELYKPYEKEMPEKQFAEILGIGYSNYYNLKNKGTRAKILKTVKIEETRKEEIRKKLIEKGYRNKFINYTEFLQLYKPYEKEMTEQQFAEILGIGYGNYNNLKNRGTRAKILKIEEVEEIRKEEIRKEEIRKELIRRGYRNKLINYVEFLELYKPYEKEMPEKQFAEIIGISGENYYSLKNKGTRAKILKTEKVEETRKEEIRKELIEKGYRNKLINYVEFLELYKPYEKEMEEKQFAEILGIGYVNYNSLKNRGTRAKINFIRSYMIRINYEFSERGFYNEEYFIKMADKYGCSVGEIIEVLYNLGDGNQLIYRTLKERGKLYVGKKKIPKEFMKEHLEYLYHKFMRYSHFIGKRLHTTLYEEDIVQEIMIILISTKGDIVENLNEHEAEKSLLKYGITMIKYQHLRRMKIRTISLDQTLGENDKRTRYYKVKAPSNHLEKTEESILKKESEDFIGDTPIEAMKYYMEKGLERTEILKLVAQKFSLTQRELLEKLEEELKSRREIRTTENGHVYLGEEIL